MTPPFEIPCPICKELTSVLFTHDGEQMCPYCRDHRLDEEYCRQNDEDGYLEYLKSEATDD